MLYSNELTVTVGGIERKVFLQDGFYSSSAPTPYMHKHSYAEIHFVSGGRLILAVDDKEYELTDGDYLAIPSGVYHGCKYMDDSAKHSAFQVDEPIREVMRYSVNGGIASEFINEIAKCGKNGDHVRIAAYISLICSYFAPSLEVQRITDSGFLISEFFYNNYGADARLEDLAELMHLSPRQTERVVEAQTGRSFRGALTFTRMQVAERLINISAMPLSEVAQYVGYRSYAGFWKAYQKYKNNLLKENASDEGNN